MSAAKTVTWGVLAWVAFGTVVRAESISSANNGWVFFHLRHNPSAVFNVQYPDSPPAAVPAPAPVPVYAAPVVPPAPVPVSTPVMPSAPVTVQSASSLSVSAPDLTQAAPAAPTTGQPRADALVNLGSTNFPEASSLTTGTPQPWYDSPSAAKVFGGTPTSQQQAAFTAQVLSDINQTFSLAGLHPNITTDPTVPASHVLSVVSGASYGPNANAIGITDVGHDGFGFIDKLSYANTPDQLAWAVAHNVSHELMHAFGVGVHPDTTGNYIDAATASWNLLIDPNATFSPGAVQAIQATNFSPSTTPSALGAAQLIDGDQEILAPVPEPAALAAWSLAAVAGVVFHRRRKSRPTR